jgi:hypothetical protein
MPVAGGIQATRTAVPVSESTGPVGGFTEPAVTLICAVVPESASSAAVAGTPASAQAISGSTARIAKRLMLISAAPAS